MFRASVSLILIGLLGGCASATSEAKDIDNPLPKMIEVQMTLQETEPMTVDQKNCVATEASKIADAKWQSSSCYQKADCAPNYGVLSVWAMRAVEQARSHCLVSDQQKSGDLN